jgi:hypothetical protein
MVAERASVLFGNHIILANIHNSHNPIERNLKKHSKRTFLCNSTTKQIIKMTFSNIARRTICVAATRAPRTPMNLNFIRPAGVAFSTNAVSQVQAVEDMLKNLRWADLKDNVHEVRDLMNEMKTNHAIRKPSPAMEAQVADEMAQIQKMSTDPNRREEVGKRVVGLKRMVKQELYA